MRLEPRREQSAAPRASYRLSSGTANPPVSAWNPSPFFTSAGWAGKAQACRGRGALSSRAGSPGLRFGCPDKGGLIPPPEESDPPRPGSPGSRPQVPAPRFTGAAAGPSRGRRGCRMSRSPCPTKPISPFWRCRRGRTPPIPSEGPSGASSPAYFQQNK